MKSYLLYLALCLTSVAFGTRFHQSAHASNAEDVESFLQNWTQRVDALKLESTNTLSKDRHKLLERQISNLEDKISNVRMHFFEMRMAKSQNRSSYLNKINKGLESLSKSYNAIPAE